MILEVHQLPDDHLAARAEFYRESRLSGAPKGKPELAVIREIKRRRRVDIEAEEARRRLAAIGARVAPMS